MQPLISTVASWAGRTVEVDSVEMYGADCGNCVKVAITVHANNSTTTDAGSAGSAGNVVAVLPVGVAGDNANLIIRVPSWAVHPTVAGAAVKAGTFVTVAAAPGVIHCGVLVF
jgi:hypothetical protein